jgi:[ribosomal protein S5]-alanine N-acetyltransferase
MPTFEYRPRLVGQEVYLRLLEPDDAPELLALYSVNRDFLKPWEPSRNTEFYTMEMLQSLLTTTFEAAQVDQIYSFGICLKPKAELIGRVTLSNIVRGVFQNTDMGYFVGEKYNGHGYATSSIKLVLRFAFKEIGLHRVAAGTLKHNFASMRVLEKAGFRREGLAQRYLKIDNKWQDHYLFGITSEEFVQ